MKILHVINNLDTGGAERMLLKHLIHEKICLKNDHFVISMIGLGTIGPKIKEHGYNVVALNFNYSNPLSVIYGLLKYIYFLRKYNPEVCFGWMYHGNLLTYFGSFFVKNSRVIWNIRHTIYDLKFEKRITKIFINIGAYFSSRVAHIIFNSETSKIQHLRLGYSLENSIVIPNGFNPGEYYKDEYIKKNFRSKLGLSSSDFVVGHLARFHPMKNHRCLLDAAKILKSKGYNFKFILAGRGVDSNNSSLTSNLSNSDDSCDVFLLGEVSNIPAFMNALDVFALTSTYGEAFPNVLGEAMLCQVPCISNNVGDAKLILGNNGVLVDNINPQVLADAILSFYLISQANKDVIGECSRNHITHNFDIETINKKYNSLYS